MAGVLLLVLILVSSFLICAISFAMVMIAAFCCVIMLFSCSSVVWFIVLV